jgi:hypothetical protein
VDTGFVKKKCYNKGIERGFDSIKTCIALAGVCWLRFASINMTGPLDPP